jgi:hypothetical protein
MNPIRPVDPDPDSGDKSDPQKYNFEVLMFSIVG